MSINFINIGYGNMIVSEKIVAIMIPDNSPTKRLVKDARNRGVLITATQGRKTRSVIVTEDNYVILSAVNPDTIAFRISGYCANGKES